jgi:hypothetical protein
MWESLHVSQMHTMGLTVCSLTIFTFVCEWYFFFLCVWLFFYKRSTVHGCCLLLLESSCTAMWGLHWPAAAFPSKDYLLGWIKCRVVKYTGIYSVLHPTRQQVRSSRRQTILVDQCMNFSYRGCFVTTVLRRSALCSHCYPSQRVEPHIKSCFAAAWINCLPFTVFEPLTYCFLHIRPYCPAGD